MSNKWYVNEDKAWFQKWWPEEVPKNVEFEEITAGDFFERQKAKYLDDDMMWFLETWMTYKEAGERIDAFATALHNLGLKHGDCVALLLPNSFQYVISYYACLKLGVIVTGINPTYKPLEVLHHIELTKAKTLITLDALWEPLVKPIIEKTELEKVIYTNIADLASGIPGVLKFIGKLIGKIPKGKVDFSPSYKFTNLLETKPNLPKVNINPIEDTATYIMTGGTTGVPKATILTHFNIVSNAVQCVNWLGGESPGLGDVGVLPLFHSFGMTAVMNVCIGLGGWMMLFPRPPETEDLVKHMVKLAKPAGLAYVGAEILFKRLAEFPDLNDYDLMGKIKKCISGAGPLHAPVQEAFQKNTGGVIVEGYGLSEASPVVSSGSLFEQSPLENIGMPIPGTDWAIFDAEAETLEGGSIAEGLPGSKYGEENTGEICVHGPQVMKGYLDKPEETASTLQSWDGKIWLRTGDIGYMREDGLVVIRDRKKQLIKVAGHSVFPKEVESFLMKHEAVSEAAVAGLPDPEGKVGEIIKAWVALAPEYEGKINAEELKSWMEKNLTKWKCPTLIEFIPEVPKNILGKVQRRALQEADPLYKEK
ncbi:MAG: AMP-binding protein [Candidatus Lokiarchaeota archaeon]|nr:AMP-binding protein [Candidatus Lokiarchaeota archaeon]MBD3339450.1 AMP-binding protein [Candidatus Lokiarchaeota archaeon]